MKKEQLCATARGVQRASGKQKPRCRNRQFIEYISRPATEEDLRRYNGKGRDHNPYVFTNWLCGGGVRGGVTAGESDAWGQTVRPKSSDHRIRYPCNHAPLARNRSYSTNRKTRRSQSKAYGCTRTSSKRDTSARTCLVMD